MEQTPDLSHSLTMTTRRRVRAVPRAVWPLKTFSLLLWLLLLPQALWAGGGNYRSLFALADASSSPTLEFSDREVTFTAATPGADVVWFGLWRSFIEESITRVDRYLEIVPDADKDGRVSAMIEGEVPATSVWVCPRPRQR